MMIIDIGDYFMSSIDGRAPPKEFLIVSLPDGAAAGSNLRLLGIETTQAKAEKAVMTLDPSLLGHVGVFERKALFVRKQAVESTVVDDPISSSKT